MSKFYVYYCSVAELDPETTEIVKLFEADSTKIKAYDSKDEAMTELRNTLDAHCSVSLLKEIERLNRVVHVLDKKITNAVTVPV